MKSSANQLPMKQLQFLDDYGYLILPHLFAQTSIKQYLQQAKTLIDEETNEDQLKKIFPDFIEHPMIQQVCHHLLQSPGKLAGLRIRAPKPNAGQQSLHTDWDRAVSIGDYYSVTFILPLVDFLSHNGASRIVPGSHRSEKLPSKAMANSNHAHEQFITCPAGSLIIINSHAWHSATQNRSNERRYSLLAIYHRDQSDQLKF